MENTTPPSSHLRLMEQLRLQEENYAEATMLIEQLATSPVLNAPVHQKNLIALQTLLAKIRASATEVDAARSALDAAGGSRSVELNEALRDQTLKLTTFLTRIDELKDTFSLGKDQLQTQLDTQSNRRVMHEAYQRSLKTG